MGLKNLIAAPDPVVFWFRDRFCKILLDEIGFQGLLCVTMAVVFAPIRTIPHFTLPQNSFRACGAV